MNFLPLFPLTIGLLPAFYSSPLYLTCSYYFMYFVTLYIIIIIWNHSKLRAFLTLALYYKKRIIICQKFHQRNTSPHHSLFFRNMPPSRADYAQKGRPLYSSHTFHVRAGQTYNQPPQPEPFDHCTFGK